MDEGLNLHEDQGNRMQEDIPAAHQAKGCRREVLAFALWMLGAAAIGAMTGALHYLIMELPAPPSLFPLDTPTKFAPVAAFVAAAIAGGVGLYATTKWALRRAQCTTLGVAVFLGLGVSTVAVYGVWHTFVLLLSLPPSPQDLEGAPLAFAILVAFIHLFDMELWGLAFVTTGATQGPTDFALFVYVAATSGYLPAMVLWSAVRTTRRQKQIAECTQPTDSRPQLGDHYSVRGRKE